MPCKLNLRTGRCNEGVRGENDTKNCIRHNVTKRCRRRTERRRPRRTRKGKKKEKTAPYKCPPGKIYNRKTKKCVKKDGPIGRAILDKNVVKTIGGPIALHYYVVKMGGVTRKIFLFGDEHTKYKHHEDPGIISITTLLKKIIRKSAH